MNSILVRCGCLALLIPWTVKAGDIVINEIMYYPPFALPEDTREEWLELFNRGSNSVNVRGWQFARGVAFTFADAVMIPPGGYLVVAADVAAFQARHPGMANVVGGWTGQLANGGEQIELRDASGQVQSEVTYSDGGDWAVRLRGSGEDRLWSLTSTGATAYATVLGHYGNNDQVLISGADPPEYNGVFGVFNVQNSGFRYSVFGGPSSPATGVILCRQLTDFGRVGWAWSSRADGRGSSLELINPWMPNPYGQNWQSSLMVGGTPGEPNWAMTDNIAPLVLEVQHQPLVPRSIDPITITARILDEQPAGVTVNLLWRIDTAENANEFLALPMYDDGEHNDGPAGDGIYGLTLPAQTNNTVIEFYVAASDSEGRTRTWPAPALDENSVPIQQANALLQVDDSVYTGSQPFYRIIMREVERAELQTYPSVAPNSDARMNATFIALEPNGESAVRYLGGIRDRGAGSRYGQPANYRLNLPSDRSWRGLTALNLNINYIHSQYAGYTLANLSGLNTEAARIVQVRVNNVNRATSQTRNFGSYIQLESTDGDYAASHFPDDQDGNVYRGSTGNHSATLDYIGTNFARYANAGYFKQNNGAANNWNDLINLTYTLSTTPDADYAWRVREVADVEEWMTYFAVFTLTLSRETSFATGRGDDFSMFFGVNDPRGLLLAHDWDTILNEGDTRPGTYTDSIFRMLPAVNASANTVQLNRFMRHPDFAPLYYRELKRLADSVFSPPQVGPTLDQALGGWVPQDIVNRMKTFSSNRTAYVLSQIPLALTVKTLPSVTLTSPTNGAVYGTPVNINLAATAADSLGISRVEFYEDGTRLGQDTTTPYTFAWNGVAAGNYLLSAVATDVQGLTTTSAVVSITVTSAPSDTLIASNSVWKYLDDGSDQGTGWTARTFDDSSWTTNRAQLGYGDGDEATTVSYGPNQNSKYITTYFRSSFVVTNKDAYASLNLWLLRDDGGVVYLNGTEIYRSSTMPGGAIDYATLASGNGENTVDQTSLGASLMVNGTNFIAVEIHQQAVDSSDISFDFNLAAVLGTVTLSQSLVASNSFWKYLDNGTDQGTAWTALNFDDSSWTNGRAQLGYGDNDETTVVSYGPDPQNRYITTYFRRAFVVSNPSAFSALNLWLVRDDGGVVYLNGVEVFRSPNMPAGPIAFNTLTLGSAPADNTVDQSAVSPSLLVAGTNVVAVEIHQQAVNSSDISFEFALTGILSGAAPPPALADTPPDDAPAPGTISLGGRANVIDTRSVKVNGEEVQWTAWQGLWHGQAALDPGMNRIWVQAFGTNNEEIARTYLDFYYDTGTSQAVSGAISGAVTWRAADGPYYVSDHITIGDGATLTIEPGAVVYFAPATGITVSGTGRLLAEGTDHRPIRFTRQPGASGTWAGITLNGAMNETRLSYVDIQYAGSSGRCIQATDSVLSLDHATFTNVNVQYLTLDNSSFQVRNSVFPNLTSAELIHGVGLPASGYGIIEGNTFGATTGLNDIIDFTGGKRPGAILQILNNTFTGASDDILDLDGTDAHIEGNIFMRAHQTTSGGDTSSAISGGRNGADSSDLVIVRNIFYDCDHAVLAKEGNFYILENNTLVQMTVAAVNFNEPLRNLEPGLGAALHGNIVWDTPVLFENYTSAVMSVTVDRSIVPTNFPGVGNLQADPRLFNLNSNTITYRTITNDFRLRPGSPALGSGPNGLDMGALVSAGASIAGEPSSPTPLTSATLTVAGPGITRYRWRLNYGAYSAETAISTPIVLTALASGDYTVSAIGKNDAGVWQDAGQATVSKTWTVNPELSRLVLNEVLARNNTAMSIGGRYPDLIEIRNAGGSTANLNGMGLTDDPAVPFKFTFPPGTTIHSGGYLVVVADNPDGSPSLFTGFGLNFEGDALYLYSAAGQLVDSVAFGPQLADFSIGRLGDGTWSLTQPTLGSANVPVGVGDASQLRINEWLATPRAPFSEDFVELYNRESVPVALGGLWLTDNPLGWPTQYQIAPLSFIGSRDFSVFLADANPAAGSNHVNFRLSSDRGTIALLNSGRAIIDQVIYPPQTLGVSQGRYPDGLSNIVFLSTPTPGAPNPGPGSPPIITSTVTPLFGVTNQVWRYEASGTDLGTSWRNRTYNDSGWPQGRGLFGYETTPAIYPYPFNTRIDAPRNGGPITAYFRTHFAWTNTDPGYSLYLTNYLDDGAVFYLNGVEIDRIRLDAGAVDYYTFAANQGSEGQAEVRQVPGTNLLVGDNVIAVEVHQGDANSSDDVFGLALTAIKFITNTIPPRVVINEVLANNATHTNADGTLTDWVELFNPSTNTTDLSDMSLSDDTQEPRRWVFPNGVVLPPGSYLVVRFDPDSPPSTNNEAVLNTGFGLNANGGDQVHLFDTEAHSRAPLDGVVFGIQASDFSIGRIANGTGSWALNLPTRASVNIPAVLGNADFLRINEWMANPNGGDDWFELFNPDTAPVALGGLYLTDDLANRTKSLIPGLSFMAPAPNGYVEFRADNNPGNGANHVNFRLSGSGEAIGLHKPGGFEIDSIVFGPQDNGISEGRFPDGTTNIVRFPGTDTPGASNLLPIEGIVINEVLSHTDLPLEDAIELHNLTASAIDVSGWYLTDNNNIPRKYRLPPGSIIEANGYRAFYEYQFNPFFTGIPPGFALSGAHGDEVYLYRADASGNLLGYRAGVSFGAAENGISFGRFETSVGVDFTAITRPTFGAAVEAGDPTNQITLFRTGRGALNAYPKVGPVVVNEIMYHPPDIAGTNDDVLSEYVELMNITGNPVPLYDPAFPGNTWRLRDAVDFDFPSGTTIPAGGFLLVVSFDPATNAPALASFRAKYGLSPAVPLVGPYDGKLANNNDSVELDKPDPPLPPEDPDAGYVPRVLVDKVKYYDSAPWPTNADGAGQSLQRLNAALYGNDPVNWRAANPTPGAASGPAVVTPPVISVQPLSQSVSPGSNVVFAIVASGPPVLRYQWRFQGKDIPGATNAALLLTSVQTAHAGQYTVRVTNPGGAAVSSPAFLTVQERPVIERAPESGVAAVGGTYLFSVLASGTPPLSYQWQHAGTNLIRATNVVLLITNAQMPHEGLYRVRVANAYGAVTSAVASLTLNAAPSILVPPASMPIYLGSTAVFSVVAGGSPPLRYQWRFNGVDLNGATNATLTVTNAQFTDAGLYSVRVANGLGSATSPDAILTVIAPPVVTVVATDPSASEPGADTGAFTLRRTGSAALPLTVTFQMSGNAAPGSDYLAISSPITFGSGVASRILSVVPLDDSAREGNETVVLTLLSGPSYVVGSPSNATITIRDDDNRAPFVTLTNPPDGESFTAPVNVLLGAAAGDPDGIVALVEFFDGTNRIGEATSAPFEFTWTNAPAGVHVLTAVATDNLGAAGASDPVTIAINAPPVVSILRPANGATFVAPATFTVSAAAADADGGITLVEFYQGADLIGVDATLPYTVTVRDLPVGTYAFAARATDSRGAVSFSPAITVTVIPPLPNFADHFAQRGIVSGFTNAVRGTNTTYTREPGEPLHDNKAGTHSAWLSWIAPAAGPVTLDTFDSDFDTVLAVYTNNPPTVQSLNSLTLLASDDDSTNGLFQSQLTFNAIAGVAYQIAVDGWDQTEYGRITFHISQPNLNPVILTQPQSQVVNQGANLTFSVSAAGPGPLSYQWRFNGADIPGATRTNVSLANVQSAHQGIYTVMVINGNGAVSSLPATLTVRVPPAITAQPQNAVVDPGGNATFSVTVSGSAPFTYQWRFNGGNLAGATDSTYTRVNAQPTHAGSYSVVVGNGAGSVTTQGAELIVRPKFIAAEMTNNALLLLFQGTPGRAYAVDMKPGLDESTPWLGLGTLTNTAVQSQFIDPTVTGSTQRVYRLRLLP